MEKLKISADKRYFVYQDGTPFTWIADTAWTIPQRLKWDDVEYYMQKRKSQGFTVLQIVALDPERDTEMRNPTGEKALLNDNLDTPNERYFAYLDWILDKAEEYGFYVLLLPVWGQLVVGWDWMGQSFEKTVTEENAFRYGEWLGARCRERKNILWCLGGDRQPIERGVDYRNVWRRMAEGLAKGVLGKKLHYNCPDAAWQELMITYHACHEAATGECSTMSYWTDEEAWISYIMLQSGHGTAPKNYELVQKEYEREKTMPVWDGEPAYEMMPTVWPIKEDTPFHGTWIVRKRAYWALLSGAFGHTYGHASMWCCISEKERSILSSKTWYEALQSEAAAQIKFLRAFMDETKIMTWKPCREILPEVEETEDMDRHLQASVSPNRTSACIYFPSGGTAELNLGVIRKADVPEESAYLWWYNPRDGKFYQSDEQVTDQPQKIYLKDGKIKVTAPTSGAEQDWILMIMAEKTNAPIQVQTYYRLEETVKEQKVFEW